MSTFVVFHKFLYCLARRYLLLPQAHDILNQYRYMIQTWVSERMTGLFQRISLDISEVKHD